MDLGESHAGTKVPGEGRVRRGYIPGWDCTVHGFEVPADALAPMFPGPDEDAGADKVPGLGCSVRGGLRHWCHCWRPTLGLRGREVRV